MKVHLARPHIAAAKLQHHVIYVERPQQIERLLHEAVRPAILGAQSSRQQRRDAPVQQEMHFFSFGFYHHDICLVKHHKLKMDNDSMLHFSLVARDTCRVRRRSAPRRRDGRCRCAKAA